MKQSPQLRLFAASSLLVALLLGCAGLPIAPEVARDLSGVAAVPLDVLNPDVRQANVQETICVSGYTATVRPSTTYTNGVKAKLLRELGLPPADAAKYELDHRIPLALGGHPRNPHNLALQLWAGEAGAKQKDQLERRLQVMVCAGQERLDTARAAIFLDWQSAFRKYLPAP